MALEVAPALDQGTPTSLGERLFFLLVAIRGSGAAVLVRFSAT